MQFGQFNSTYKPLPLSVYERTGEELEQKYYKNREENSLLRQSLANAKVEDRNIGILAKATTDVEDMLASVDGKWHYASNILYNAKERLTGDALLTASMEDYAKSQAAKADVQKRFDEGKIDQNALSAFYINDKRYNNKTITKTVDGQIINRWNTPTPINKTDYEKKVLDIVQQLTLHKDTLATGNTKEGPLAVLYKDNPQLEGYITKYTSSGISDEKIAAAVQAWINTTPEVKQYMNYINDAKIFDQQTLKDDRGNYLKDENGEFIQKSLTPKDFRDIGIPVADNWWNQSNTMILPGVNGTLQSIPINNQAPNFKESGMYKELREQGLSDKEALRQIYVNTLTNQQTKNIVDFGRQFAFNDVTSQDIENKRYWFNLNRAQQKLDNAQIFEAAMSKAPLTAVNIKLDPRTVESTIRELSKQRDSYTPGTPEYNKYQNDLTNYQATNAILRKSFREINGGTQVNDLFAEFLSWIPNEDKNLFITNKDKVTKYISGESNELGFAYDLNKGAGAVGFNPFSSYGSTDLSLKDRLNIAKTSFTNNFTEQLQKGNINLDINTIDFLDKNGAISKVSENLGTMILDRGDSFVNLGAINVQGQPMTLDDYYKQNKVDRSKYTPIAQYTDHYGKFAIKFIPKDKSITPLKDDARILIEPNVDNKDQLMLALINIVKNSDSGESYNVNKWLKDAENNLVYGKTFEPVYDNLALLNSQNIPRNKYQDYWLSNVPLNNKLNAQGNIPVGDFKITFNQDQSVSLYQTDATHTNIKLIANRATVKELQDYLMDQYTK